MSLNTQIKFKKDKNGKIEKVFITGGVAYYTKINKPSPIFEQRDLGARATKTEYTVDLVVTEDVADEYDEVFTKQPSKKLTKEKFKKQFRIEDDADLPDPKAKKFFVIKLKQAAQKSDGSPIHDRLRPRVVEIVDGKPVDITFKKLVGNGSAADVMLAASSNDFGTFSYLRVLKVTDLIEYASAGGGTDEDEEEFLGGSLERDGAPEQEESEDHEEDGRTEDEEDDGEFEY